MGTAKPPENLAKFGLANDEQMSHRKQYLFLMAMFFYKQSETWSTLMVITFDVSIIHMPEFLSVSFMFFYS